jgi:hypothetical protein
MFEWSFHSISKLFLTYNQLTIWQPNNILMLWWTQLFNLWMQVWQQNFVNKSFCGVQGFSLKVKSHPLLTQLAFPWLFRGIDLCVVLVNSIWKKNNNPSVNDETMNVICFLSIILMLWCVWYLYFPMYVFLLLAQGALQFDHYWPLRLHECCKYFTR